MKWQPFFNFFIMANFHWHSEYNRPKFCGGGSVILTFFHTMHIYKILAIFQFFHNSHCLYSISINTQKTRDANFGGISNLNFFHVMDILFPKCKFSVGSVSPSLNHFIPGSISTFKYDYVSTLKTFRHGYSCLMTFLCLKHIIADANFLLIQFSEFSIVSVFPINTS